MPLLSTTELLPTLASRSKHLRKHLPSPSLLEVIIGLILIGLSSYLWTNNLWRLIIFFLITIWGLNYLFDIVWTLDLFPSPWIGFGLIASVVVLPLPLSLIAVWAGWPALTCLGLIYFVVIANGLLGRYKVSKEIEQIKVIDHPLGNSAKWVFGVSRRFTSPFVEDIYKSCIKPLLLEHGCVVECLYAEDESSEADFWLNRMRLIYEIADFHVLIEHDISSAVYIEHAISIGLTAARKPYPNMLEAIFGADHPIVQARPRPCVIAITPQARKTSYRLNRRSAIVAFSGALINRVNETEQLHNAIINLKKRRILDLDPNVGKSLKSKKCIGQIKAEQKTFTTETRSH